MSDVISREIATTEVNSWLDYKKVNDKKRETYKDNIDTLIEAVMDGSLVLDSETKILKQTLRFPIGEDKDVAVSVLEFKPRLKVSTVHAHLQGVKSTDADGRLCAYMAALTSKPKELLKAMDTEDYNVGMGIAIFFL